MIEVRRAMVWGEAAVVNTVGRSDVPLFIVRDLLSSSFLPFFFAISKKGGAIFVTSTGDGKVQGVSK